MNTLLEPEPFVRKAVSLYRHAPLLSRAYLQIRVRNFPLQSMWPVLMGLTGQVVSIGAGYGIFEIAAALANANAHFLATDLNKTRVALGQTVTREIANVEFAEVDLRNGLPDARADVFLLLDVLHHLTPDVQDAVIDRIASALHPGGRIVIKECGTRPWWKRWFNRLNDLLGAPFTSIYPRSESDWSNLLQAKGFASSASRIDSGSLYAHILIQGTKI